MSAPRLRVDIDEVVLRGVPAERASSFAPSLEARLLALGEEGRLLSDAPERDESFRDLEVRDSGGAGGPELGARVADALWGELIGGGPR